MTEMIVLGTLILCTHPILYNNKQHSIGVATYQELDFRIAWQYFSNAMSPGFGLDLILHYPMFLDVY